MNIQTPLLYLWFIPIGLLYVYSLCHLYLGYQTKRYKIIIIIISFIGLLGYLATLLSISDMTTPMIFIFIILFCVIMCGIIGGFMYKSSGELPLNPNQLKIKMLINRTMMISLSIFVTLWIALLIF